MSTFVLVHGAWHGGWCWARTEAALQRLGHRTFAPTLTGLGERSHLLSRDITPDLHVRDIVNFIRWRELGDVILVGHSYGGIVITGAAGLAPEPLRALVYLDAMVPEESGVSLFSRGNPERMAAFQKQIDAGAEGVEPDLFAAWSDEPETIDWLKRQCTPQPIGTLTHGVTLTGREAEVAHRYFILAARNKPSVFWAEYDRVKGRKGWRTDQIDAMHDAMVDRSSDLARLLDAYARTVA